MREANRERFSLMRRYSLVVMILLLSSVQVVFASSMQSPAGRKISGVIVDHKGEVLNGVAVIARGTSGERRTTTNETGQFSLDVPNEDTTLRVEGQYIKPREQIVPVTSASGNLRIEIDYLIPPIHQSIVITASALEPQVETHSDEVYKRTLFSRDDQLLESLNGGINAGQHEGGGKSLEIRRFGFNLDHGGVNGRLKVLVDDIQQNKRT